MDMVSKLICQAARLIVSEKMNDFMISVDESDGDIRFVAVRGDLKMEYIIKAVPMDVECLVADILSHYQQLYLSTMYS